MSNWERKILGVLVALLGAGMLHRSIQIIHGEIPYPTECHYKRLFCELTNLIFEQGGYFTVGMINMAFSLFIIVLGIAFFTSEA